MWAPRIAMLLQNIYDYHYSDETILLRLHHCCCSCCKLLLKGMFIATILYSHSTVRSNSNQTSNTKCFFRTDWHSNVNMSLDKISTVLFHFWEIITKLISAFLKCCVSLFILMQRQNEALYPFHCWFQTVKTRHKHTPPVHRSLQHREAGSLPRCRWRSLRRAAAASWAPLRGLDWLQSAWPWLRHHPCLSGWSL